MVETKDAVQEATAGKQREIWTAQEVADFLRCTPRHVTNCANRKELPGFRVGNVWRFRRKDIETLVDPSVEEKDGR